jgi:hypothetical protein
MTHEKTKPQNPCRNKGRNKTVVVDNTKRGGGGKRKKEKRAENFRIGFKIWHIY